MNNYLRYIEEEEGRNTIDLGDGFIAYSYTPSTGELYISKLFVCPDNRGKAASRVVNCLERIYKETGATHATATIRINESNKGRFLKKLSLFNRFGYNPQCISGEAVILLKKIKE